VAALAICTVDIANDEAMLLNCGMKELEVYVNSQWLRAFLSDSLPELLQEGED
jgi:hypothetical protein